MSRKCHQRRLRWPANNSRGIKMTVLKTIAASSSEPLVWLCLTNWMATQNGTTVGHGALCNWTQLAAADKTSEIKDFGAQQPALHNCSYSQGLCSFIWGWARHHAWAGDRCLKASLQTGWVGGSHLCQGTNIISPSLCQRTMKSNKWDAMWQDTLKGQTAVNCPAVPSWGVIVQGPAITKDS